MSCKLATATLEKLKCCRCCCLLSIPPITFTQSEGFLCGRCNPCNTEIANNNVPYEAIAKHYYFPCRYENFGCKQKHTFHSMKTHEQTCEKRPFLCPLLPKGACLWRGNELLRHLREKHAECFVDTKIIELDLQKMPENCNKAFVENEKCFLIRFLFDKTKGITINLLDANGNCNEYGIKIHSLDFEKTVKLSACKTSQLNGEIYEYFVDRNTIGFISTKTLLIEVVFVEFSSKINKNILSLLECPVCTEIMKNTIFQCKTGHSFCENCNKKLSQCPICAKELTNTLNYALMQLSTQIYLPCKNKEIGCNFEGFADQIVHHENFCRRFECPLKISNGCRFSGEKDDLFVHCSLKHEYLTQENHHVRWSLKTKNTVITKIICAYNYVFRSCRKFTGNDLFWAIQCYGSEEEAAAFSFSVEFERDGKKLVFSDRCATVTDETRVFENAALCVPCYQLRGFVSGDFCTNNLFIVQNNVK